MWNLAKLPNVQHLALHADQARQTKAKRLMLLGWGDAGENKIGYCNNGMHNESDGQPRPRSLFFIAVFTRVGAAGFSTIFFDHSYIFAPALLDVQHLDDSTDKLDFHSILMASLKAFSQH